MAENETPVEDHVYLTCGGCDHFSDDTTVVPHAPICEWGVLLDGSPYPSKKECPPRRMERKLKGRIKLALKAIDKDDIVLAGIHLREHKSVAAPIPHEVKA